MPSDTRCPTTTCWYYSLCCYGNGDAFPNACKDAVAWFHTTPEQVDDTPRDPLMEEGYRECADLNREMAEENVAIAAEVLPEYDTPRDEVMAALDGGAQDFPRERYSVIYADPPWRYSGGKGKNSAAWGNSLSAYPCMKAKDIAALPIESIAADDAALFLWGTWPLLQESLEVMAAWGFTYKTCAFVWNKTYPKGDPYCGMGYWTRSGSEFCLLGFRGRMERLSTTVYQVVTAPVTRHSAKPEEVRRRIVELMGDVPRIELFCRTRADGWDAWGNEVVDAPPALFGGEVA